MSTISELHESIREVAFSGDLEALKPLIANPALTWQPDEVYGDSFESCYQHPNLLSSDEKPIKSYVVWSLNSLGVHQERVLIITNQNLIRVKFNFDKNTVLRFEKTRLVDLDYVHYGKLVNFRGKLDPAAYIGREDNNHSAVRVHRHIPLPKPGEDIVSLSDDEKWRTFIPILGINVPYSEDDICKEIALVITACTVAQFVETEQKFDAELFVSNTNITMFIKGNVWSSLYNFLGLGVARTN
ncbi:hypothetical protein RCL1_000307 [Eukaryota sp. TZLM3-RCL]